MFHMHLVCGCSCLVYVCMYVGGLGIRNWLKVDRVNKHRRFLILFGNDTNCEISTFSSEFNNVLNY